MCIVYTLTSRAKMISMAEAREIADKFKAPSSELTRALSSKVNDGSTLASSDGAVDEKQGDASGDMLVDGGGQNYDPDDMTIFDEFLLATASVNTTDTTHNNDIFNKYNTDVNNTTVIVNTINVNIDTAVSPATGKRQIQLHPQLHRSTSDEEGEEPDDDDDSDASGDSDDNSDMIVEVGGQNYDPDDMDLDEPTNTLVPTTNTTNGNNNSIRKPARSPASYLRFPVELNNLPLHTTDITLSNLITTNTHILNPNFIFNKSNSKKYSKDRRGFYTLMCDLKEPNIYKIFKSLHRSQRFLKISTTDEITRCCKAGGEAYGFRWKTIRGTHEECKYMHSCVFYLLYCLCVIYV